VQTTKIELRTIPKNVAITIENYPNKLDADISPKPMVKTVIITYHAESINVPLVSLLIS